MAHVTWAMFFIFQKIWIPKRKKQKETGIIPHGDQSLVTIIRDAIKYEKKRFLDFLDFPTFLVIIIL